MKTIEIIDNKKLILEKTDYGRKPIHFIGVGGIGMSGLAAFILNLGFKVSGSDIKDGPNMLALTEKGAIVYVGHDEKNIGDAGLLVVSTAIDDENPEIKFAKANNIEIIHRSQLLEALMSGLGFKEPEKQITIGVSGTHGKTSTTGMIGLVLDHSGLNPSIVVGGKLPELMTNAKLGDGKFFVSELDESDGTISIYNPSYTIISNIEKDHVDHYEDGLEQLLQTFEGYISRLKDGAEIVVNIDDNGNNKLLERIDFKNVIKYSSNPNNPKFDEADYKAKNIELKGFKSTAEIYKGDEKLGVLELKVPGAHNISNALATIAVCVENGLKFEDIALSLSKFTGMRRRFQLLENVKGVQIVDDYAHHPTEIKATLKSAKNIVDAGLAKRVVAIFQPHRYSRLQGLWEEFKASFENADEVFVVDVFSAGEKLRTEYNSDLFAKETGFKRAKGALTEVANVVVPNLKEGDIVITIGAGSITKLGNILIEKIK